MEDTKIHKHILLLAVAILLAETASAADLVISEVLYNPQGPDSEKEFIELYNNGETTLTISNWTIETAGTTFSNLLTIPNGETIPAKSHYLIGGSSINPDLLASISLQNGGSASDGVRIKDGTGTVVDALLYDNPNSNNLEGEGEPAESVTEGKSLARTFLWDTYVDTNDNLMDFFEMDPTPTAKNVEGSNSDIIVTVEILSSPPEILNSTMFEDDDLDEEGIQLIPYPDDSRQVLLQAWVRDSDWHDNIAYVQANLEGYNKTLNKIFGEEEYALFEGNISLDYFLPANNYTLDLKVVDQEGNSGSDEINFTYAELLSLDLDTTTLEFPELRVGESSLINGDLDVTTLSNPTIKNTGNVEMNLFASSLGLTDGADVITSENIGVSTDGLNYTPLEFTPGNVGTLNPSITKGLSLNLTLPEGITMGSYAGSITLITTR